MIEIVVARAGGSDLARYRVAKTGRDVRLVKRPVDQADLVVAAMDGDVIVGWLGVCYSGSGDVYWGVGTWVDVSARRQGLARRLWARMLEELPQATFDVLPISAGGQRLIEAIGCDRITFA